MQYEAKITLQDLKAIFNELVARSYIFNLKLKDNRESEKMFQLVEYNDKLHAAVIAERLSYEEIEISLLDVEWIEFESFHTYKGLEAKIFKID